MGSQGRAGGRRGTDAAPLAHCGTPGRRTARAARLEPERAGRQCLSGGAVQAARPRPRTRAAPPRARGSGGKALGAMATPARRGAAGPARPLQRPPRVRFTRQVPGPQTHLLLHGAAGARAGAGAGAAAVLAVRLQVAHGAGEGAAGRNARASAAPAPRGVGRGAGSGALAGAERVAGDPRGGERGSSRVGPGSH